MIVAYQPKKVIDLAVSCYAMHLYDMDVRARSRVALPPCLCCSSTLIFYLY